MVLPLAFDHVPLDQPNIVTQEGLRRPNGTASFSCDPKDTDLNRVSRSNAGVRSPEALVKPRSTREKGTMGGAAIGAGSGAFRGMTVVAPLAGAATGGVASGRTGMAIRNSPQNSESQDR